MHHLFTHVHPLRYIDEGNTFTFCAHLQCCWVLDTNYQNHWSPISADYHMGHCTTASYVFALCGERFYDAIYSLCYSVHLLEQKRCEVTTFYDIPVWDGSAILFILVTITTGLMQTSASFCLAQVGVTWSVSSVVNAGYVDLWRFDNEKNWKWVDARDQHRL